MNNLLLTAPRRIVIEGHVYKSYVWPCLLLIYKAITQLMTIKITKIALVNMYLTTGGWKIRVLGYTPEMFSLWLHAALWGLTLHTL